MSNGTTSTPHPLDMQSLDVQRNGASVFEHLLGLDEVTQILRMSPERVQWLLTEHADSLSNHVVQSPPLFTHEDLATLITLHRFARGTNGELKPFSNPSSVVAPSLIPQNEDGETNRSTDDDKYEAYVRPKTSSTIKPPIANSLPPSGANDESFNGRVPRETDNQTFASEAGHQPEQAFRKIASTTPTMPLQVDANQAPSEQSSAHQPHLANPIERSENPPAERPHPGKVDQMLGEMLSTVANSQQSILNVQDSVRDMLGVIAQDNFNLKHENRKLRERMLELERVISEHQRREETRKEMLESRMRAVEGTLSALQQQLAQLVQLQRQRIRKNWFR
ncbi:MAG: hypothetical protein AAF702_08445 [Chloroflexota bacterium]